MKGEHSGSNATEDLYMNAEKWLSHPHPGEEVVSSEMTEGDHSGRNATEDLYKNAEMWLSHPHPGDEVVISGIAGKFPECESVFQFKANLLNKVDMIGDKDRRWGRTDAIIPKRYGQLPQITKFDAGYFGIGKYMAHSMDPSCRMQLEAAVEAVMDAGVNPVELEGSNTGIFIVSANCEAQSVICRDGIPYRNILGVGKFMYANRISYHLKLRGPSVILDSACSSSLYALREAYNQIRDGKIDAAIVGGVTLIMDPQATLAFKKLGVMSRNGKCKVFDESADGYVRSETSAAIFLQKLKNSRRMYAKVTHVLSNCAGYNEKGITHPSHISQVKLMREHYEQCDVLPSSVEIVEAHGTGTRVGDLAEINSIGKVFCTGRDFPLVVGSTKSNMGHAENSAGHCQIIKSILVMENGLLFPNLHLNKALDVAFLRSGNIQIPTQVSAYAAVTGRIGISSYGFGGTGAHCLLEWNKKAKSNKNALYDELPRLVCISGRCEENIYSVFNDLKEHSSDYEYVALLHKIYKYSSSFDIYRGFIINTKTEQILKSTKKLSNLEKPHLFIEFGGDCFQNIAMDLLHLPLFQQIIQRMDEIVLLEGVSISELLRRKLSNGLLAMSVIQITIFKIFETLGLRCHSQTSYPNGKIANAYAEGKLSLKEALRLAYKLEYNEEEEITYSPANEQYTEHLFQDFLIHQHFNNIGSSITSSSTYVILNFQHVQGNKPKGHDIEAIQDGEIITIDVEKGIVSLLTAIGRLYELGYNPDVERLYPSIQFPVSRATPMISPLIKWDHTEDWFALSYRPEDHPKVFNLKFGIDARDSEWSYIKGHVVEGKNIFPAAGYLFLVWKTFSKLQRMHYEDMYIVFEHVKLVRATLIADDLTDCLVSIQPSSGHFEVIESGEVIANGKIRKANSQDELISVQNIDRTQLLSSEKMNKNDIYKEFKLHGYEYSGMFEGLEEYFPERPIGIINLVDDINWVVYMDLILQMYIIPTGTRKLYVPTQVEKLSINAPEHLKYTANNNRIPIIFDQATKRHTSGHICLQNVTITAIPRRKYILEPVLEKYVFVPNEATLNYRDSIRVILQIVLENIHTVKIKIVEIVDKKMDDVPLTQLMYDILPDLPLIQPDIRIFSSFSANFDNTVVENKKLSDVSNIHTAIGQNLLSRKAALMDAINCLSENGFVVSREPLDLDINRSQRTDIEICVVHKLASEMLVLLRKRQSHCVESFINISHNAEAVDWLNPLQNAIARGIHVTLYSENQMSGILGLTNCLRKEPHGENIRSVFVHDISAPPFNPKDEFYRNMLHKGLAFNVYNNGKWGTYRHLKLEVPFYKQVDHCFANIRVPGDLCSFSWAEGKNTNVTDPTKQLVHVYYSALNFKDMMLATNRRQGTSSSQSNWDCENPQGVEFSGKTNSGRVMGICESGSLATKLVADKSFLVRVPDDWSLEDAATVPVVYSTVLYAFSLTKIRTGQSILIHSGTGGIGQAAINLAEHHGLVIFTTVGNEEKREYIKQKYPYIPESHIGNSRDASFEQLIRRKTKGKGVDIVLNSLSGEKLLASLRCLAFGGVFFEIGVSDVLENNPLRLEQVKRNCVFHGISTDKFSYVEPHKKKLLMSSLNRGVIDGSIKPLKRICFSENELTEAYKYMANGSHIGKVLIKMREEEEHTNTTSSPPGKIMDASPRYYCYSEHSYIITGGLGGIGLELANWLVSRGARKLVLSSRVGIRTGYQQYIIRKWKIAGCEVLISTANITTREGCKALLEEAIALAPVAGIFHLAMILEDAILENQTVQSFYNCLAAKANPAIFLDELSRNMCPELRDFVVFSSAACGRGTAGQTNYGMANSIMERICEKRRNENLPALAVQWGAVGQVGLVAEMHGRRELDLGGTLQQNISSCLEVMDRFMAEDHTIVSSMVVADKRSTEVRFNNLVEAVMHMLGIKDLKTISIHATLPELGMDSMVATELKQYLEREKEIFVSASVIRNLTFSRLLEMDLEKKDERENNIQKPPSLQPLRKEAVSEFIISLSSNAEDEDMFLVLLPGIEGRLNDFDSLLKTLNGQIWGVTYNQDTETDTIQKDASFCFNNITNIITSTSAINIVAHSYGCLVALELAAFLEKDNQLGKLILINGSPKHLTKLLTHNNISHMEKLRGSPKDDEKIENFLNSLPDTDYSKGTALDVQRRMSAVKHYQPSFAKIKSPVYLFTPKVAFEPEEVEGYCLLEHTEYPVEVKYLEGDHFTILQDSELGRAINECLQ